MKIEIKRGTVKEMGTLNAFYINSELEIGDIVTSNAVALLTNAPETEFKDLLNSYLSDNDFNSGLFMSYVAKNGYYCTELDKEVLTRAS